MADPLAQLQAALQDRYAIERELGRGGMATVFLAHDLRHDRPVALKVLHAEVAAALGPERFQREIMLAARLQHPHILAVHDSGESAGRLWFTMPFVEGKSLRDRLNREKQLPLEDALRVIREAALGLEYAHQHGVIHRDIKPENLLLNTDGTLLVADFGIARALAGDERLTQTGLAIGTPAYMSPEQATGTRELDARTDVYALGCVLYEMLAGEPPYSGPTAQAIIARALTGTPRPVHPIRPAVPDAVDSVIARAMAVTPADRYPSMLAFARALGVAVSPELRAVPPPSTRFAAVPQFLQRRPFFAMLVLGVLLGGGALFAWQRSHRVEEPSDGKLLAVLPFHNLGSPEEDYFADGVADAVRGKLSAIPGLQVIASGSANHYRHTSTSPAQIAQELGVQYLLVGEVRWQKTSGGASQVQVTTELVQVTSGPPTTKWQAPFDAALTDVFQVQADIAGRVAQALNVVLGDSVRRRLAKRPTQSLAAYDAFLRGEAASQGMTAGDPPSLRRAVAYYGQAVALDSMFVEAWAQLSRAHSLLYFYSAPTPAEADVALHAAERALALAPNRPDGHRALGSYYSFVLLANPRALTEDTTALALAPGDADLLAAVGADELYLGRWTAARAHLEQAVRLDPRSMRPARTLGRVLLATRHYPEARRAYDRALALAPTNLATIGSEAMVALAQGDLAGARAVLRAAPKEIDPTALVAHLAVAFDLMWVLDDVQQALLLGLAPSAFDGDRGMWGIVLAQTYALRSDGARARVYADSARLAFEEQLRTTPNDAQRHVFLGLALAYLGRKADAMREGERAVGLVPITRDAFVGPYMQHQLARIYLLVREPDKALDQLELLLKIPYYLSSGWLKIDPNFDPLRGNPRFERLVAGH
jgi:serine/threonine protein kinase/Tfp pilus assembly protein PilF